MPPFLLPAESLPTLDHYLATETGGLGLGRATELGPEATIREITRAGLRGRGGGGFLTGRKWAGVRDQPGTHRYVVCNGAEGEPGTYKDRALLRANPYQVVEGLIVADASLMGQHTLAYVILAYLASSLSRRVLWFPLLQQALPITFGIGSEYPFNIFDRSRLLGGDVTQAVKLHLGAITMCSYTTIIGYGSLVLADNKALQSFGRIAMIGEMACLYGALFFLPSVLHLMDRHFGKLKMRFHN